MTDENASPMEAYCAQKPSQRGPKKRNPNLSINLTQLQQKWTYMHFYLMQKRC